MTSQPNHLIDQTDRKILQILQNNFPMVERPYQHVAEQLNLTENQVIERLKKLSHRGIIRKIGAITNNSKTGLSATTLVALKIPKSKVDTVAPLINQYLDVSHNYEREHEYNVWFTLKAKSKTELATTLEEITQKTSVPTEDILNLPTKTCFKIDARFNIA